MGDERTSFIEALSWSGRPGVEFLLYGMRPRKAAVLRPPELANWPDGTAIERYTLADNPWPVAVDLFEIHSPSFPQNHQRVLFLSLLDLVEQGITLGWYMFDGAFDGIAPLFTPWQVEQTYGICIPWHALGLALTPGERRTKLWTDLAEESRIFVTKRHPRIRKLEYFYAASQVALGGLAPELPAIPDKPA